MPNIILDLRECTDEQKQLVLRVMDTMDYTWASGTPATSTPLRVSMFTYLYMNDSMGRKTLLYGTHPPTERDVENYDAVVSNIESWFALEEMRDQQVYIDGLLG